MALRLLTAASFWNQMEAHQARMLLECEGIPCALAEENTITWFPHFAGLVGGVKVLVRDVDLGEARQILEEAGLVETHKDGPANACSDEEGGGH